MKLGLISDSHDHLPNLEKALRIFKEQEVGRVLHAGDFISPFTIGLFKRFQISFSGVFGNNDGEWLFLIKSVEGIGTIQKGPVELEIEGKRIALMHEPVFISPLEESKKFSLIVYGHTHTPFLKLGSSIVINPGECCGYLTGKPTVAIADLEKKTAELITL